MARTVIRSYLYVVVREKKYRTRAIITRGLYTFYPLFEVHLCTVTFGLKYGQYSRAVSNQEWVIVVRLWYIVNTYLQLVYRWIIGKTYVTFMYRNFPTGHIAYQEAAPTDLKIRKTSILQHRYRKYSLVCSRLKGLNQTVL